MNDNKFYKYEYVKKILESEISIILHEFERKHGYLPVEHVKSRLKSENSIKNKLNRKGLKYTYKNAVKYISDILGIRMPGSKKF